MAHKFADEIIFRLGGGIAGNRGDADLLRQRPDRAQGNLGHGLRRLEPAPDHASGLDFVVAARFARWFAPCLQRLTKSGWEIMMYSLELNRSVSFPHIGGTNLSPAWSADGTKLAFSSSRGGEPEIYVVGCVRREFPPIDHRRRGRMFLRYGTARRMRKSRLSAGERDCRRFIPWKPTAPTSSA